MLKSFFHFFAIALVFWAQLRANTVDLGQIDHINTHRPIPIAVIHADAELGGLLNQAFQTHGGFNLVPTQMANFTLLFTQKPDNTVLLTIEGGGAPYQKHFTGKTAIQAVLKAADDAVYQILGTPGFFASHITCLVQRPAQAHPEIILGDLFFRETVQVTHHKSELLSPKLSKDGRYLIYTSYHNSGHPDVCLLDIKACKTSILANWKGINSGGTFSPTGEDVALVLSSHGTPQIFLQKLQTGRLQQLTNSKGLKASPAWSPEGKKLYYTCDAMGKPQIYVLDIDTKRLARVPTNISGYCAEPSVNQLDPTQIAFTAASEGTFQIALYQSPQTTSQLLTQGDADHLESAWLADGRHLIVTKRTGSHKRLHILDSISKKLTPLHSDVFNSWAAFPQ